MILYGNMTGGGGNGNPADTNVGYWIGKNAEILPPGCFSQKLTLISFPKATKMYTSCFSTYSSGTVYVDYLEKINLPKIETFIIDSNYYSLSPPFRNSHGNNLKEVYLGNEANNPSFVIPSNYFMSTTLEKIHTGARMLGSSCFYNCTHLVEVSVPLVKSICMHAFYGCTNKNFQIISLPAWSSYYTPSVFINCYYLTTVYAPNFSGTLGTDFINRGDNLKSLYLGDVKSFDSGCLNYINYASSTSTDWKFDLYLKSVTRVPNLYYSSFTATFISISSYNNSSRFSIHVPSSLYNSFISASGWSTVSARITSD